MGMTADTESQKFKADASKAMPDLFELGFANAIRLAQATKEYGAQKYEAHSWRNVPNGLERYTRACARHRQERQRDWRQMGLAGSIVNSADTESGLPHIAHEIFNLMAMLELALDNFAEDNGSTPNALTDELISLMKKPPTHHKE